MNQVQSEFESSLHLDRLICTHLQVERSEKNLSEDKLQMQVQKHIEYLHNYDNAKVTLKVKIFDRGQILKVEIIMVGYFVLSGVQDPAFAQEIMEKNTVAIMFPYVRSQISLATTQPGFPPVVIPAININALLDNGGSNND